MPWPIRLLDVLPATLREDHTNPDGSSAGYTTWRPLHVGDAWFLTKAPDGTWRHDPDDEHAFHANLSPYYLRHNAHRPPLIVCLPSAHGRRGVYPWCVDEQACNSKGPYGEGWAVTGTPPNITLSPSINIVGSYHGWIRNGVISDDCEGRRFPNACVRS